MQLLIDLNSSSGPLDSLRHRGYEAATQKPTRAAGE
jgi:hypothetical protein